jgi:Zn finger protein HypA/HybF involved in hydrogenase expression
MGSRFQTTCRSCHHQFNLTKGGGMKWYQKVCDTCGSCTAIPRNGPEIFEDGVQMTYLEMVKHLADPTKWSRKGGKFDADELKLLDEITSVCSCGGKLLPEWNEAVKYRCPECKSPDLELGDEILFD